MNVSTESEFAGIGSTHYPSGSLRVTINRAILTFTPRFLETYIIHIGDIVQYDGH